jgi:hypothetical protein
VIGQERILRQLNLVRGVRGIVSQDFIHENDTAFRKIIERLKLEGYVEKGDYVVFTAGLPLLAKGTTDTISVEQVEYVGFLNSFLHTHTKKTSKLSSEVFFIEYVDVLY